MIDFLKSVEYTHTHRDEMIQNLSEFLLTDTILFWSDVPALKAQQQKEWQPLLDIFARQYGLNLEITTGLSAEKNAVNKSAFAKLLQNLSDKELASCFLTSSESKSPLLGYLFAKKQIDASAVFVAAFLEELYQNLRWGTDEAASNKHRQVKSTLNQIAEFLAA